MAHLVLYDLGVLAGARAIARDIRQLRGLKVRLIDDHQPKPLNGPTRALFFESLRQMLLFVAEHTHATAVTLHIKRWNNSVRLLARICGQQSAGSVLNCSALDISDLSALEQLLQSVGGSTRLDCRRGKGVKLTIQIPLAATPKQDPTETRRPAHRS